mmetsp:Transcript_7924/g.25344  ORF Transcript_7924/g.25344 Transcript_7924/m.25344 type:complete len:296 (-) Transcript_7924:80-967(-)
MDATTTLCLVDSHPLPTLVSPTVNCSLVSSSVLVSDAEVSIPGYSSAADLTALAVQLSPTTRHLSFTASCADGHCAQAHTLFIALGFDVADCTPGILGGGGTLSLPCVTSRLSLQLVQSTATVHTITGTPRTLAHANVTEVLHSVQVDWLGPLEWAVTGLAPANVSVLTVAAQLVSSAASSDYLPELYSVMAIDVAPPTLQPTPAPATDAATVSSSGGNPSSSSGLDVSVLLIVLVTAGILLTVAALACILRHRHVRHRLIVRQARKRAGQSTGARKGQAHEHLVPPRATVQHSA